MTPFPQNSMSSESSAAFKKTIDSKYGLEISSPSSSSSEDESIHPTSRLRPSELVRMARRRRNREFRDEKDLRKEILHDSVLKKVRRYQKECSEIRKKRQDAIEEQRSQKGSEKRKHQMTMEETDSKKTPDAAEFQGSPAKQQNTSTTDSYDPFDMKSFFQRLDARMLY
ncbi:hypothetical protein B9Z55_008140 [Caenorhabditis nigoni]|uniref:Uncharacterized protein n=1 Tax=Caenorhabditis nigoni TaxID=1611254 RepID=A0A2G5VCV8_9PELO|nr:hypothetical protein B9Z55_008140 [Caenorhabditis nigoni]